MKKIHLLILILCCACAESASPTLGAILPSPVSPGDEVSIYGTQLSAATLSVGGVELATTQTPTGLSFQVPGSQEAGVIPLELQAGRETFERSLQVIPRIDNLSFTKGQLVLRGVGWTAESDLSTIKVTLNGLTKAVVINAGELIVSDLPERYGRLNIRVTVNEQASATSTTDYLAASLTGRITTEVKQQVTLAPQMLKTNLDSVLIVTGDTGAFASLVEQYAPSKLDTFEALNVTRLTYDSAVLASAALAALNQLPDIQAQYDAVVTTGSQSAKVVAVPAEGVAWHLQNSGVPAAWDSTLGEGIVVAVVDSGVAAHPDLELLPGYDFVDEDDQALDEVGHGTHVAGLIAANGGVKGVAPGASVLPVRVLSGFTGGSTFDVARGILWAAGLSDDPYPNPNPADIINLSLGTAEPQDIIRLAVEQALINDVIVIAAAGNDGGGLAYPAAQPGVLAVTAIAGPLVPYQPSYASRGPGVFLSAYGGDLSQDQDEDDRPDGVLSLELEGYGYRMGTSMAAPQVSGLAALALARGVASQEVKPLLAATATELGPMGVDDSFGYGLMSGRIAGLSTPMIRIAIRSENGSVLAVAPVYDDLSYSATNLLVGQILTIQAYSDEDGDGVYAEAGERSSDPVAVTLSAGETLTAADLTLMPVQGPGLTLEVTP